MPNVTDLRQTAFAMPPIPAVWLATGTLLALAFLVLAPDLALAQTQGLTLPMADEIRVKGKGWSQLQNPQEMLNFLQDVVETALMTAAIAFHPVGLQNRRTAADFEVPRTLFIYSLIGMTIGFLIVHHGYLIGFVVFGIGGLLRFRTDVDTTLDTTRLITVTLIGLCVGLDLPVMGAIATACAWAILYFLGRETYYSVEIKFDDKKTVTQCVEAIRGLLAAKGFAIRTVSKSKFKPTAQFVLTGNNGVNRETLVREMTLLQVDKQNAISDWHLE